jgi:hypothetical protein
VPMVWVSRTAKTVAATREKYLVSIIASLYFHCAPPADRTNDAAGCRERRAFDCGIQGCPLLLFRAW